MPELIDDFGDPDRSPASRVFTRTAHLLPWAAVLTYAVRVVVDVIPGRLPTWLILASGFVIVPIYFAAVIHHGLARICVRCMRDVPADASRQAARKRLLLRAAHLNALQYLAIWGSSWAIGTLATGIGGIGWSWVFLGADSVFLGAIWAEWTHHRLRPWCRYCRRWDDGQGPHELVPDPDPAGMKTA